MSYEFELDWTRQYNIHKLEEEPCNDFFNKMFISRSTLSHLTYFMMCIANFHEVKIYEFDQLDDRKKILKNNLLNNKIKYSINFGEDLLITASHLFFGGMCYSTLNNDIFLVEQSGMEKFQLTKKVKIGAKIRSLTITAICYGKTSCLVMVGTAIGDFYVYDTDIGKIVFTYREINCKIIDIKFFEGLKNIYIFWNNGRIKVLDSTTYEIQQEVSNLQKVLKVKGPDTFDNRFVYMTNIDEILDNPLNNLDDRKQEIVEMFSDKMSKPIRYNTLDRQIVNGNVCIVLGNSCFNYYNLQVRADKQFKQMVDTYKKVNKELVSQTGDNYQARVKFFDSVCNYQVEWRYCAVNCKGDKLLLINDSKFVVYIDLVQDVILKHFLLDMDGDLCRCTVENEGKELHVANKIGRFVQYDLATGNKLLEVKVPLSSVIWVERQTQMYELTFFNNPDEVISLHRLKGINNYFEIDKLTLGSNMDAFRMKSNLLFIRPLQKYILVFLENFKISLLKKQSMKQVKEYDLLEYFEECSMKSRFGGDYYQFVNQVYYKNQVMYIHFDEGNILILKFNEDRVSDINVYLKETKKNFQLCINDSADEIYTLNEGMYLNCYEFQPYNDISLKEFNSLKQNKEMTEYASQIRRTSSVASSIDMRQLAASSLGRTGDVFARRRVDQLDPLFEQFKNELQRITDEKIRLKEEMNKQPSYLLSSILGNATEKPKYKDTTSVENYLPTFKDVLSIFYVGEIGKLCVVLKRGNLYMLDKNVKDIEVIRINKKLKERKQIVKKSAKTLKDMIEERKEKQRIFESLNKPKQDISQLSIKQQLQISKDSINSQSALSDTIHN